ncbi:PREDICTED: malignant fibrous histiocytoma-amplified sequence 1 homolog [Branchiostoma belcheri]|uniref:non-specific serine/threonine protein kinase n=1 Tax=Branchiostoma belcheri TaxID=7741 RepID=A0A6P4YQC6_BRABE|nr:PREDICTED: malignant fibrous histiocytoma-amplified sequence 1 homolog [Branchiostoma belcheri]
MLRLYKNKLQNLPDTFCNLRQLEMFYLGDNGLSSLPRDFGKLTNLADLWFGNNRFEDFPEQVLCLVNLKILNFSGNSLKKIPEDIHKLNKLENFYLDKNDLTSLPESICRMTSLTVLHLQDNRITALPMGFGSLVNIRKHGDLRLKNNPLCQPPLEVCAGGIESIAAYQEELGRSTATVVPQVKLTLVGTPLSGKTSLSNALIQQVSALTKEEDRTHGVQITPWSTGGDVKLLVYDFGGHPVYHMTHQLFLTKGSLHILTVDLASYRRESFPASVGKWVDILRARVPGTHVLLAGTHVDQIRDAEEMRMKCEDIENQIDLMQQNYVKDLDRQMRKIKKELQSAREESSDSSQNGYAKRLTELEDLKSKPLKFSQVFPLSSAEGLEGVEALRAEILRVLEDTSAFPDLRRVLPKTWADLETRLESLRKDESLSVSWSACRMLASEVGLTSEKSIETAVGYLHRKGVILHYSENEALRDHVFPDPVSIVEIFKGLFHYDTDSVFSVDNPRFEDMVSMELDRVKTSLLQNGLLSRDVIHMLLTDSPMMLQSDLVMDLLLEFGLCYPVPTSPSTDAIFGTCRGQQYRFPSYLQNNPPQTYSKVWPAQIPEHQDQIELGHTLKGFCPPGLFERLCVRIHPHVTFRQDWKDGVMACKGDLQVMVQRTLRRTGDSGHESAPTTQFSSRFDVINPNDEIDVIMTTRADTTDVNRMWKVILPLQGELDNLLNEWPGLTHSAFVTCPHCSKNNAVGDRYRFPGQILQQPAPEEDRMVCPGSGGTAFFRTCLVSPLRAATEADTNAQPTMGQAAGSTVNSADVKGFCNTVIQTGSNCIINMTPNTIENEDSEVQHMTVEDVEEFLQSLRLDEHTETFRQKGVDGAMLARMDDRALRTMGVRNPAHRKVILEATAALCVKTSFTVDTK